MMTLNYDQDFVFLLLTDPRTWEVYANSISNGYYTTVAGMAYTDDMIRQAEKAARVEFFSDFTDSEEFYLHLAGALANSVNNSFQDIGDKDFHLNIMDYILHLPGIAKNIFDNELNARLIDRAFSRVDIEDANMLELAEKYVQVLAKNADVVSIMEQNPEYFPELQRISKALGAAHNPIPTATKNPAADAIQAEAEVKR